MQQQVDSEDAYVNRNSSSGGSVYHKLFPCSRSGREVGEQLSLFVTP